MRAVAILLALGGCTCGSSKPDVKTSNRSTETVVKETGAAPLASKEFYRLDPVGELVCVAREPCVIKVALSALAGHHVNPDYPTKFVPVPSADVPVEGTGTFAVEAETRGVMSIRVIVPKAGTVTLKGQFRLSVCTDNACEIDGPEIALPIRAT